MEMRNLMRPEMYVAIVFLFALMSYVFVNDPALLKFNDSLSIGYETLVMWLLFAFSIFVGIRTSGILHKMQIPIIILVSLLGLAAFYHVLSMFTFGVYVIAFLLALGFYSIQKLKLMKNGFVPFSIGLSIVVITFIIFGVPIMDPSVRYNPGLFGPLALGFYLMFLSSIYDKRESRKFQIISILIAFVSTFRKLIIVAAGTFLMFELRKNAKVFLISILALLLIFVASTYVVVSDLNTWDLNTIRTTENRIAIAGHLADNAVQDSWPFGSDAGAVNERYKVAGNVICSSIDGCEQDSVRRSLTPDTPSIVEPFVSFGLIGMMIVGLLLGYFLQKTYASDFRTYVIVFLHSVLLLIVPTGFLLLFVPIAFLSYNRIEE